MNEEVELPWLPGGNICSPKGFEAGGVDAGIKSYGDEPRRDLGLLVSQHDCAIGGIFTQNAVVGAPVHVSRGVVQRGSARGIIINSGCSNVAMGEQGVAAARRMQALAASHVDLDGDDLCVGSTGVIGRPIPMDKVEAGLARIAVSADGGGEFARAMMTTDTTPKQRAVTFTHDGIDYVVAGAAKGSGMAHPNMATVFCFLTTDANTSSDWAQRVVKSVGDRTINMVDVDMDTSTSDMMLLFANGAAGGPDLSQDATGAALLERALLQVATSLAKDLARDGEGARTLIEMRVRGAASIGDARLAARTVVSSPLVKTMVTGKDPNLGRVLMALGRSGARLALGRLSVWLDGHLAFDRGEPTDLDLEQISAAMASESVLFEADLGVGDCSATAWGCDLTEGYIRINADYTT